MKRMEKTAGEKTPDSLWELEARAEAGGRKGQRTSRKQGGIEITSKQHLACPQVEREERLFV